MGGNQSHFLVVSERQENLTIPAHHSTTHLLFFFATKNLPLFVANQELQFSMAHTTLSTDKIYFDFVHKLPKRYGKGNTSIVLRIILDT